MKLLSDNYSFPPSPLHFYTKDEWIHFGVNQEHYRMVSVLRPPECTQPLYTQAIFIGVTDSTYQYRHRLLNRLGLEWIQQGTMLARRDKRCYLLEAGDIFLLPPGSDVELAADGNKKCRKTAISIRGGLLKPYLEHCGLFKRDCIRGFNEEKLKKLVDSLQDTVSNPTLDALEQNSLMTYQLLQLLVWGNHTSPASRNVLNHLIEFMEENLDQPLDMQTLCQMTRYSESGLLRQFHLLFGQTPHQLLMGIRMRRATRMLLKNPHLQIQEIATMVGYSNPLNFSTAFRKFYGISPRSYRKRGLHSIDDTPPASSLPLREKD